MLSISTPCAYCLLFVWLNTSIGYFGHTIRSDYIIVYIATAIGPNYSGGSPCQSSGIVIIGQYFTSRNV